MKHHWGTKVNRLTIIVGLQLALVANASMAGYAIRQCTTDYQNAPNEACSDTYGNAQNPEFSDSLQGTVVLTPTEQQFMQAVIPLKMQDRFYIRAHAGLVGWGMGSKFASTSNTKASTINVRGKAPHRGGSLGYQWTNAALELEYLGIGKLRANNVVDGSTIESAAVLLNGLYYGNESPTFIPWLKYQPYFIAGVGYGRTTSAGVQQTQSNGTNGTNGIAFGLGVGLRGRLTEHFMLDTAIRAQAWPSATIGTLKSKFFVSGAWFLGLEFMF